MCDGRLGTDTHSRDGYKHEHVALGERTEGCGLMAATTLVVGAACLWWPLRQGTLGC